MAKVFEAWGGPADGETLLVTDEMAYRGVVYLKLPRKSTKKDVYKTPPSVPYTAYLLGEPAPTKCRWMGDVLTEEANDAE